MNFWTELASQPTKEQLEKYLLTKLGNPQTSIQTNLYQELLKKINSYYYPAEILNPATFSLFGSVQEIQAKQFKEGKRKGETYYLLKLATPAGEKLKASQADLPKEKWNQITKSAILGKNLVFQYRKWITNKELLDFSVQPKK